MMKKVISIMLAVTIIFAMVVPSFAAGASRIKYPVIYIHGNSGNIVDENDTVVYDFDVSREQIISMCREILPKLGSGLITGNLEPYYDIFEQKFEELYDRCALDTNGNAKYGTNVEKSRLEKNKQDLAVNRENNGFGINDYTIYVDWRLDPLKNADFMNSYIDGILKITKKDKVCLVSDCLGSVNIISYLAKYGHDKIYGIGMIDPVGFGSELMEEFFCGTLDLNADSIERFCNDRFLEKQLPAEYSNIIEFIKTSVDLAYDTGLLQGFSKAFIDGLYNRLKNELVPRLMMASYGTWPSYWALVSADRYQEAKSFIFGAEDSERAVKWAEFIKLLDNYDNTVRQHIPEILTSAYNNGVKIAIVAKYGFQLPCVFEHDNRQSDVWVSLGYASLGATCANIGETLSDEYIEEREAMGLGKYISPDRIVDTSTCLFPETTWLIKNCIHNEGGGENDIVADFLARDNVTVENGIFPQFSVRDRVNNVTVPMTEENCHTETYYKEPVTSKNSFVDFFIRIGDFFKKVISWFKQLVEILGIYTKK